MFPGVEVWVDANSGLLTLLGTIAAVLAVLLTLVFSARVRAFAWRLVKFLFSPVLRLAKFIGSTSKRISTWCADRWERVTTPLEDRKSIANHQRGWDTERAELTAELSKAKRRIVELRKEVNTVAKEREGFRSELAKIRAQRNSEGTPAKERSANTASRAEVDLEIRKRTGSLGLSRGGWVLHNWGPGTAYNVYVAADDPDTHVVQDYTGQLSARQEILLLEDYSAFPRQSSLLEPPKVRVSYEEESGEKKIVFIPFPRNLYGL